MQLTYTPEQERLRQELRDYFAGLMTAEVREALATPDGEYGNGEAYRQVVRQLGRDGWLALSWPTDYGGRGGTMLDQLIFTDEAAIAGAPVPFLTINTVGPTIMRYGTVEQKARYLPRIAGGEIHFSIGYSEPEAGTDLAALRTLALLWQIYSRRCLLQIHFRQCGHRCGGGRSMSSGAELPTAEDGAPKIGVALQPSDRS